MISLRRERGINQLNVLAFIVAFCFPCIVYAAQVSLTWERPHDERVSGYNIYFGLSGTDFQSIPYATINSPEINRYIFQTIEDGFEYSFAATSLDSEGNESDFSETVYYFAEYPDDTISETRRVVFGDTLDADYPGTVVDTFINLNDEINYAGDQLNTYTWPENMPANAIILLFDLTELPADARVQSATLSLYQTAAGGDALYDVSVHKLINHHPDLYQATGFSFDGQSSWTANTVCYQNIPLAQADIAAAEDVNRLDWSNGYKQWDITHMVQEWLSDAATNYGMLLNSDDAASSDSYRFFAASEWSDPDQRPSLELIYSVIDGDAEDDVNDETMSWSLDIEGDGEVNALTDGILIIRYLLGFSSGGSAWIDGAAGAGATRSSAGLIESYIQSGLGFLDIDGDGEVNALTDGILILRYLLGFSSGGPEWIDGAVGSGATRITAEDIEAYIMTLIPQQP